MEPGTGLLTVEPEPTDRVLGIHMGSLQQSLGRSGVQPRTGPWDLSPGPKGSTTKGDADNVVLASPSKQREGIGVRTPGPEANQASPPRVPAGLDGTRVEPEMGE